MTQFGTLMSILSEALAQHPEWTEYPVHVCAIDRYTTDVGAVKVFLATHANADGTAVTPETAALDTGEATELATPIVVVQIG